MWDPISVSDTCQGQFLDIVCEVLGTLEGGHIFRCAWHGNKFSVVGWRWGSRNRFTVYGIRRVQDRCGLPCFEVTAGTCVREHCQPTSISFRSLIEVCSGIGGFSLGAQAAQVETIAFLDKSALACATVQANGGRAVRGDIQSPAVRRQVHLASPDFPVLLGAGFPCQPFSRQGSGQALADPRSEVLGSVLLLSWQMQCAGLILECVDEVQDCEEAKQAIRLFASKLGLEFQEVTLELADQWASHRKRWWAVLLPAAEEAFHLQNWTKASWGRTVGEIIPEWPIWSMEEEASLKWTVQEAAKFGDVRCGKDPRYLDMRRPAPVALHSYGSPLDPCPCGCRKMALPESSLLQKGLRGFAIYSARGLGKRHIHPQELGLLNGVPPSYKHPGSPRSALCMLGQIASPLQSLWIFAQVSRWRAINFNAEVLPSAEQALETFKRCILQQRDDGWVLPSMWQRRQLQYKVQGALVNAESSKPMTACDLLEVEARKRQANTAGLVSIDGRQVSANALIPTRLGVCIEVQVEPSSLEVTSGGKRKFAAMAEAPAMAQVRQYSGPQAAPSQAVQVQGPEVSSAQPTVPAIGANQVEDQPPRPRAGQELVQGKGQVVPMMSSLFAQKNVASQVPAQVCTLGTGQAQVQVHRLQAGQVREPQLGLRVAPRRSDCRHCRGFRG